MYYETMPLYPTLGSGREDCVRVPVFDGDDRNPCNPCRMPDPDRCRRVMIENPCRPGEYAEVLLGLDERGCLVVCVRRRPDWGGPGRDCPRPRCDRPRPDCGERVPRPFLPPPPPRCGRKGRLYGSW